jgi:formylmethanofuran dehydrogenase subunit A
LSKGQTLDGHRVFQNRRGAVYDPTNGIDGQVCDIWIAGGKIVEPPKDYGKPLHVAPEYDRDVEPDIQRWFEDGYSIRYRNYPVHSDDLNEHEVIR